MARLDSGVHVERRTIFDIAAVAAEVAIDAQYETRAHHRRVRFQSSGDCFVECGTGTGLGLAIAKRSFEVHGGTA